tara:strand:- start:926 stop:1141 length:216 start_codon:yes stop_codon:yes gene_type:complete
MSAIDLIIEDVEQAVVKNPYEGHFRSELELSKLKKTSFSGSEFPTNMAWFLGQTIKVVEPVSNVDQGELNL